MVPGRERMIHKCGTDVDAQQTKDGWLLACACGWHRYEAPR